jgi:alpha-1,3-mannosyltransferase
METDVMDKINIKYRVVHVVPQFSPAIGGLENLEKSLAKEQIDDGLDGEVVTLNRIFHQKEQTLLDESEIIEGIKVTRTPYKGSYKYPFAPSVLKKITTADIVHVYS